MTKESVSPSSQKLVALVVEDDPTLRFLAKKQLAKIGVECQMAVDGREAIAMAANGFDLIFMDLSMPNMDGLEATSHIREQELRSGRKRTPIIGVTAFNERDKCIAAGMDEFIQKPMLLEQLRAVAEKYSK